MWVVSLTWLSFLYFLSVRKVESWQLQSVQGNDGGRRLQKAPGHFPSISFLVEYERSSSKLCTIVKFFNNSITWKKMWTNTRFWFKDLTLNPSMWMWSFQNNSPSYRMCGEIKQGGAKANANHWKVVHHNLCTYHCTSLVFEIFTSLGWFYTILSHKKWA